MTILSLVMAPNPIFKQTAATVEQVDDEIRTLCSSLLETLYEERGIGIAAPMVGVLKRIIVVDLQEQGTRSPIICVNPVLKHTSSRTQKHEEASLCFPGIRAEIERPASIELDYLDADGKPQSLMAEGWLATVIQHEMEYLDGKTFLDNLSKLKRDRLIKKMLKDTKHAQACGDPHCGHDHY